MNKFLITTAIDYPNSRPHIGTAFEKIGADAQARWRRMNGFDVFFLMGNDENTIKVYEHALKLEQDPQKYCDEMARQFREVWDALGISYTRFIQTTEPVHVRGVQHFVQRVYDGGFIYKKAYVADYCPGCEEFKTASNLEDGKCPNHPNLELTKVEEENWFFKVKPWVGACRILLDYCRPESRKNEVLALLEKAEDVSISRPNRGWGIPLPWDETQVVYVWFDALINYLTGVGFGTDEALFRKWWPANAHIVGKDIARFHCALWPSMIYAYNNSPEMQNHPARQIPQYGSVVSHGFVMVKGDKVSKSGVFVDPMEIIKEYGADAYRYYFMSKCSFLADGDYDAENFKLVYNAELANNLGNLVSRLFNLIQKWGTKDYTKQKTWFTYDLDWMPFTYAMYEYNYRGALSRVWQLLDRVNEFLESHKPWAKEAEGRSDCLRSCAAALRIVTILIRPFMPNASKRICETFGWDEPEKEGIVALMSDNYLNLGEITLTTEKCEPLFPRKK